MPTWLVHLLRKLWSWGKFNCSNNPLILLVLGLAVACSAVSLRAEGFFFLQKHQLCFLVYQISNNLLRENIVSYKAGLCLIALAFFHLGFHQPFACDPCWIKASLWSGKDWEMARGRRIPFNSQYPELKHPGGVTLVSWTWKSQESRQLKGQHQIPDLWKARPGTQVLSQGSG